MNLVASFRPQRIFRGKALKPGDILKSLSGQTIEIVTTDAKDGSFWPTPSPMPAVTNPLQSSIWRRSPGPASSLWVIM